MTFRLKKIQAGGLEKMRGVRDRAQNMDQRLANLMQLVSQHHDDEFGRRSLLFRSLGGTGQSVSTSMNTE